MPELPEVEVSRMGISPHMIGQTIKVFVFRTPKLRWDIPQELKLLEGQVIRNIRRRAKYLLIDTDQGTAIIHLACLVHCVYSTLTSLRQSTIMWTLNSPMAKCYATTTRVVLVLGFGALLMSLTPC